jgi:hypothetical protein
VPAGIWDLTVSVVERAGFVARRTTLGEPLVRVRTTAGEVTDLGTLAADLRPATLSGTVLVDGAPPATAQLHPLRQRPPGAPDLPGETLGPFPIGADGSFTIARAAPGAWRPVVLLGGRGLDTAPSARTGATEALHLVAGPNGPAGLRLPGGALRRRLLDPEGHAIADQPVTLGAFDGLPFVQLRSDADGVVELAPAPELALRVFLGPQSRWQAPPEPVAPPAPGTTSNAALRLQPL